MQGNKKRDNINKNIPLIMIVFIVFIIIIIIQYMLHFGSLFSIKIDQSVDGINIFPVIISLHNTYINITEIYASNFILFITFIHSHKMAMRSDRKKDDDNQNDKATKKMMITHFVKLILNNGLIL